MEPLKVKDLLASIVPYRHKEVYASFGLIKRTMDQGSVITIDCGVDILAQLNGYDAYHNVVDPYLLEQLFACPIKQLPSYAEKALKHVNGPAMESYRNLINTRLQECEKASQRQRLEKLLRSLF